LKKLVSSDTAVALIKDGDVVAINGFIGFGHPEELSMKIEERFLRLGSPRNLTLVYAAGQGDYHEKGINHYAHTGLTKRVICGHIGLAPKLGQLVGRNLVEGYAFPQGVITHLFRAIAGGKPGVVTHVGLGTFVDPRLEGGKLNAISKEDLVQLLTIDGREWMLYKSFPINIALIRGTTADEAGNITMEKEAVLLETLAIAQAAKNSGGIVIAEVERVARRGTLNPRDVKVPGILVDLIVVAAKENRRMSFTIDYDPALSHELRVPSSKKIDIGLNERKVIGRRAAMEIRHGDIVNLGIGIPDAIGAVTVEEGMDEHIYFSIESGLIGGIPADGLNLGAAANPDAVIEHPAQFDFYDGGGLDIAFLGMAQADHQGNVNVSKFGSRVVGPGGFINISQNAKKVVFCGTFKSGRPNYKISRGKLTITDDGNVNKFVAQVEQITFSGQYAQRVGQEVLYITERAVFKLTEAGVILIEVAPGVDVKKDILDHMEFQPVLAQPMQTMDKRIFTEGAMGIREEFLGAGSLEEEVL